MLLLMVVLDAWLATIISMGIMMFVFFAVFNKQAIGFNCDKCGAYIESNNPWICGFKQCRNDNADAYPFVHRCEHCGAEPKAYQCHHCGKLIFLTEDELKSNYARCTRSFKERSDLDIPSLEQDLRKAGLELNIEGVDKEMERLTRKQEPAPYEEDKRKRANEEADMDHQMLMIKRRAIKARAEADTKALEEANLPETERAKRKYDRKVERFKIAAEGRALAKKSYPEDSIDYKRDMAIWKEYEEEGSIRII